MGGVFPELGERAAVIVETLQREENSFNETLDRGLKLFEEEIAKMSGAVFSGDAAFDIVVPGEEEFPPLPVYADLFARPDLAVALGRFQVADAEFRAAVQPGQRRDLAYELVLKQGYNKKQENVTLVGS